MSKRRFLNAYELGEITRRHELAKDGNPLRDLDVLNAMYDSLDDIPKLLSEIERLKEIIGDAYSEILRGKEMRAADIIAESFREDE